MLRFSFSTVTTPVVACEMKENQLNCIEFLTRETPVKRGYDPGNETESMR
jgi:hypothetical protein